MLRKTRAFPHRAWLLALALPLLAGCGGKVATVTGKVTYKGGVVTGGTVTFVDAKQKVQTSPIDLEGNYSVTGLAKGTAKISVSPPANLAAMPGGGMKMDPSKMGGGAEKPTGPALGPPVKIPPQYQDPEKSGLTYTVQSGKQEHNIELK